jgi:glutamate 5-kinase
VVIKVGSAVLTNEKGLDPRAVARLADQIAALTDQGRKVVLVSSGAVATGRMRIRQSVAGAEAIDFKELPARQAASAIGQSRLMHEYDEAFGRFGKTVAQISAEEKSQISHRGKALRELIGKLQSHGL